MNAVLTALLIPFLGTALGSAFVFFLCKEVDPPVLRKPYPPGSRPLLQDRSHQDISPQEIFRFLPERRLFLIVVKQRPHHGNTLCTVLCLQMLQIRLQSRMRPAAPGQLREQAPVGVRLDVAPGLVALMEPHQR